MTPVLPFDLLSLLGFVNHCSMQLTLFIRGTIAPATLKITAVLVADENYVCVRGALTPSLLLSRHCKCGHLNISLLVLQCDQRLVLLVPLSFVSGECNNLHFAQYSLLRKQWSELWDLGAVRVKLSIAMPVQLASGFWISESAFVKKLSAVYCR